MNPGSVQRSTERSPPLALRTTNALAGWIDLRQSATAVAEAEATAEAGGSVQLCGHGHAVAVRGRLAGLLQQGSIICAVVGSPRFDSRQAADALAQHGVAGAWIALYREFGPQMFARVHGGWSLVLIDLARRQTLAAVDRFAIRPLCFRFDRGVLAFASRADEIPGSSGDIDWQAVFDYAYHRVIPAPRTIFSDVSRLDPAHRLIATESEVQIERHWSPRFAPQDVPFAERREAFVASLRDAVSGQLEGESIGCYLSGGTDSSTVAGMVGRITGTQAKTFSIGFDAAGYDEMRYARIAARQFGTDHHEYYITPQDLVERIPEVAASYDQPFGNSSALPAYFCARLAADSGVTRMLAGDGGDELFGGNSRYATDRLFTSYESIPDVVKRSLIEPIALGLPLRSVPLVRKGSRYVEIARLPVPARLQLHNVLMRVGPAAVFTPELLANVDVDAPHRRELAVYSATPPGATLNRTLAFEWKYVLADNDLPKVVGTAALAGVDVGFPLLDDGLVDFSLALPPELKVRGFRLRWFFREALRGFLPDEIIAKKKHGFGLPFGVWTARTPALREIADNALSALEQRGVIRSGLRADLFGTKLHEHPGYFGELIWVLMMLEQWLARPRVNGRHTPSPDGVPGALKPAAGGEAGR